MERIPRIIHYCWFGPGPMPKRERAWMEACRRRMPEYAFMLWNEGNFDVDAHPYCREAHRLGRYAFVSDVARLAALESFGGIYLDTDVEVLKPFDDVLDHRGILGFESGDFVATSFMGFEPHHPFLRRALELYRSEGAHSSFDASATNVRRLDPLLKDMGLRADGSMQTLAEDVRILPAEWFSAYDYIDAVRRTGPDTHCIHHCAMSWLPRRKRLADRAKRLLSRRFGSGSTKWLRRRLAAFRRKAGRGEAPARCFLQACAYTASFPGSFIASLEALEETLAKQGVGTVYAFPEACRDFDWCRGLAARTKVLYLPVRHARIRPSCYASLRRFVKENRVSLIHSHFELYDFPAKLAAGRRPVVWHLHDVDEAETRRSRRWLTTLQYRLFRRGTLLLSASEHDRETAVRRGFPDARSRTVLNGIDARRIRRRTDGPKEYAFVALGWDYHRKGIDLLWDALDRLEARGLRPRTLLIGNDGTRRRARERYGGDWPAWVTIADPVSDNNAVFDVAGCFLSASRSETFSYAACEAAYAGLDVVASDIPGLEWAHSLPSVRFFASEDPERLAERMLGICGDGGASSPQAREESRRWIAAHLTTERWVEGVLAGYRDAEALRNA